MNIYTSRRQDLLNFIIVGFRLQDQCALEPIKQRCVELYAYSYNVYLIHSTHTPAQDHGGSRRKPVYASCEARIPMNRMPVHRSAQCTNTFTPKGN